MSNKSKVRSVTSTPRLMIAAPNGHSGKTTVSIGLCAAFRQRGLSVQPFKKGPDYIDTSWLSTASGAKCRNLDPFLMTEIGMVGSFHSACRNVDLAIIEGNMGLFDSFDISGYGSSAHVSRLFGVPIVLVINTSRITRSVAALVNGYQNFEPGTDIAGVILNNVSGSRHKNKLVSAINQYCGIPVLGIIHKDSNLLISERHLGLIPSMEALDSDTKIEQIRSIIEASLDLDGIFKVARGAETIEAIYPMAPVPQQTRKIKIGMLFDKVFNFYYAENLEALEKAGAELVQINSLSDTQLPEIDALYIGGGFPELFAKQLEANVCLRRQIAEAAENGLPVYAECAGLMYLCRNIRWHRQHYEMVGLIPAAIDISAKPQGHGYTIAEVVRENPLFPIGKTLPSHEFHHSKLSELANLQYVYEIKHVCEAGKKIDGIIYKNVFASYVHLHAAGVPEWATAFVSLALKERKHKRSLTAVCK